MITVAKELKVAWLPEGRKCHLWADGTLCGVDMEAGAQYGTFAMWDGLDERCRCKRCATLLRRMRELLGRAGRDGVWAALA